MKAFLERNKIFFEIFTSVLLGIMAIIVSYQANLISEAQLKVANESQQISERQYLPEIEAKLQRMDSTSGKERYKLVISNIGESMYEFQSYEIAYLSIRELQILYKNEVPTPDSHLKVAMIPLTNYFPNVRYVINYDKGVINTLEIDSNNTTTLLSKHLAQKYKNTKKSIDIRIESFIRVNYKDKFGSEHTNYFRFGMFGESIAIDNEKGIRTFSEYREMTSNNNSIDYKNPEISNISRLWEQHRI